MRRARTAVVMCMLAAGLLLVGTSAASTSVASPTLKGIEVSFFGPGATVKKGSGGIGFTISVTTSRRAGVAGPVKVRAYLPGVRVISSQLSVDSSFHIRYTAPKAVAGGASWTFSRLPQGYGFPATIATKITAPKGRKLCDKVVVTIGSGKSGVYSLGCFTVT